MIFFAWRVSKICSIVVWGMFSCVARRVGLCHFWFFNWLRSWSSLESEVKRGSPYSSVLEFHFII